MTANNVEENYVFAMDIGTRSIIGIVGYVKEEKVHIVAVEKQEHEKRAMLDGQIEDIDQVSKVAGIVKAKLEAKVGHPLKYVYVAAAGRSLRTQKISFELELDDRQVISEELLSRLENGALTKAEDEFSQNLSKEESSVFYMVGYSVIRYYLDHYPMNNLRGHKGKTIAADMIATFLPGEVVDSLYATMQGCGLEVAGMTLEPIASMNAAIPEKIRLLNLVLVDIGAGTSDIACAKEGGIFGYTMATVAGDEITEVIMKECLVDFQTAEQMKFQLEVNEDLNYLDVLGFEHTITVDEIRRIIKPTIDHLCEQVSERILEINGQSPSAVFLVGGGSKLEGLTKQISERLQMEERRVAIGGNNFETYAEFPEYQLKDPEYSTPIGIAVSAGLNLIHDSFYINLNGKRAKLFRSGALSVRDILLMNGYTYRDMISRSAQRIIIEINGKKHVIPGEYAEPAVVKINDAEAQVSTMVKAGDVITFVPAKDGKEKDISLKELVKREYEIELSDQWKIWVNDAPVLAQAMVKHGDRIRYQKKEGSTENPKYLSFYLNGEAIEMKEKEDKTPYQMLDMLEHSGIDYKDPKGFVELKVNGAVAQYLTTLNHGDDIVVQWREKNK